MARLSCIVTGSYESLLLFLVGVKYGEEGLEARKAGESKKLLAQSVRAVQRTSKLSVESPGKRLKESPSKCAPTSIQHILLSTSSRGHFSNTARCRRVPLAVRNASYSIP